MNEKVYDVELEKVTGGDIFYIDNHIMKVTVYSNNVRVSSNSINAHSSYIVTSDEKLVAKRKWRPNGEYYCNIFHTPEEAVQFARQNNYSTRVHSLNEWTEEVILIP